MRFVLIVKNKTFLICSRLIIYNKIVWCIYFILLTYNKRKTAAKNEYNYNEQIIIVGL